MMPDGWRPAGLPEVASLEMGETLIAKDLTGEGIPVFSSGRDPAPWGYTSHGKKRFKRGTIVLGARGTIGFPRLPPFDTFVSTQTTIAVTPLEGTFPAFLKYALDSQNFDAITAKQAVPMLTIGALQDMQVLLPPPAEQQKIAAILSSVDEAIEATQAVIDQLQVVKKAMMAELLTRGLPGRHTRFKQTEIGEVPESWAVTNLGGVVRITTGKLDSNQAVPGGPYPFFTCSQETLQIDRYSFDCEAILLAGNNARGVYAVKHFSGKFDAYQRTYVITVADTPMLTFPYLKFSLELGLDRLTRLSTGTSTKFLTLQVLNPLALSLPPIDEQHAIGRALASVEERLGSETCNLDGLIEAKRALMSVLLTGEVRVKPDEEPA
jgi:type I restriction enzyme S subunit